MAPTLKAVSDSELVEESRRRFTVLQVFIKDHIKILCNGGEETDDGIYEAIEDWRENKCTYFSAPAWGMWGLCRAFVPSLI